MSLINGIIFRASDEVEGSAKDPYKEKFENVNINCVIISVLNFAFINLNELKAKLSHPENYAGIIFSSPRCVKAVRMCVDEVNQWKKNRIFVIGEKTKKLVETELDLQAEGSTCGNAKSLAEFILKQNITKPLLVPVGNLSRDVLTSILTEGGIILDHLVVYNTLPDPAVETCIKEIFNEHTIRYILYFSPSAVDFTFPIFLKLGIVMNDIKWCAIGKTTESALLGYKVQVSVVPELPTPEHFALALERLLTA